MSSPDPQTHIEHIAVIAMAGKFPGAASVEELWRNLCEGRETIRHYTDEELLAAGVEASLLADPHYVKAGTVLDGADKFDAAFFGLSAREAEITDPQHRLFLETAHEAVERAGYDPQTYAGAVGVFAGAAMSTYWPNNLRANPLIAQSTNPLQLLIGNDKDFVPTRVSYKLGLRGPSVNVQCACSTSLVAVHLACQSLLEGACDLALAGGVSVRFPQGHGYLYEEEGIMSPDGHCRPFDAEARGTVGGNGVGVVVLKRYSDAVRDGDRILARIIGSAINNDGAQKIGYTAPGVEGQAEAIAAAHAIADVDARTISYVETHGTATLLGDPIEMTALTQAFRATTKERGFCAIGSLKSNVGHLDTAAGVSGLIKTVLQLQHKKLVPMLHFQRPNPRINFAQSPFFVNTTLADWKPIDGVRRAGVSSFGLGGTNAHMIVEEAEERPASGPSRRGQVLTLSAKTGSALETAMRNLASWLREHPECSLADVAFTLHVGRTAHPERMAFTCASTQDAIDVLEGKHLERMWRYSDAPMERPVVFMFPGGGAQYPNMGRGLYESEAAYREAIDRCAELFRPHVGIDLRELMYPTAARHEEAAQKLKQTGLGLPALFATEYAQASLWNSWGIQPDAMIGHSLGEYTAACVSGVFSLEDAVKLVAARSRLMQTLRSGSMVALNLPESEIRPLLGEDLQFAAINGPALCVVSGPTDAIAEFSQRMEARGVECRRLHIDVASHCKLVEPILDEFAAIIRTLKIAAPKVPYISNVTGTWITAEQVRDPNYWTRHLRSTVRFADGLSELMKREQRVFLEVGPGHTLTMLANQHPAKAATQFVLASQRHPRDSQPDAQHTLNALALLWTSGVRVNWKLFHKGEKRLRVELPTYPFERQSFWVEPLKGVDRERVRDARKKTDLADFFYTPVWKQSVGERSKEAGAGVDLVFSDGSEFAAELMKRLVESGRKVVTVRAGEAFEACSATEFVVEPRRPEQYEAVLKDLQEAERLPSRIVHLWCVARADTEQDWYGRGFHSLVFLGQAYSNLGVSNEAELVVVTNNLHAVGGEPTFALNRATVLGPCRVLPQEYPNLKARNVDVDLNSPMDAIVSSLIAELGRETEEPVVALRSRDRWIQTVAPIRLEAQSKRKVREGAAYLITGGLGGIALELAEHLAGSAKVKIALLARSEFPERLQWEAMERSGGDLAAKIAAIRRIESTGSLVRVLRADVGDRHGLTVELRRFEAECGAIRGVIHAAGLPGGGVIQLKTAEAAELVFRPKVDGTIALLHVLADRDLDFLVLCSSLSGLVGGVGHVDYCAANAFLGVLAKAKRNSSKFPIVCADWNAWQGVGMAANVHMPGALREWQAEVHSKGITAAQGREAFDRILASGLPQVAVSTQDLGLLIEQHFSFTPPDPSSSGDTEKARSSHSRPNLPVMYIAPRTDIEREIASQWQTLLGVEPIGVNDNFFSLGGHSLLGTRAISRLRDAFGVDIRLRQLFEKPTIAALAAIVAEQQAAVTAPETQRLVEDLLQLSDEEVERELARRQAATNTSA